MATATPALAAPIPFTSHLRGNSIHYEHSLLLPPPGHHNRELKENAPYLLKKRSSKWFILITVCVALFTDSFIYGVLVPVLPFMLRDRDHILDDKEQLWTSALFAGFGVAILIGSPICGYFADHSVSRQAPLLLGLPILAIATVLLGVSGNVWILLLSRVLQGSSTAIAWTVGLALTVDTVGKDEVGQWMGTALSSSSIGLVVSPLLGGIVYASSGLWGVLGMMIGLITLNVVLISSMIEKHRAEQYYVEQKPDSDEGQPIYSTFTTPRTQPDIRSDSRTDSSSEADSLESTNGKGQNIPPLLRLIRNPRILAGAYGVFTQFGLLASFDAFLPLFVQRRFGWGSLGAGLIFLTIAIPALTGPLAGRISDRYGPRRVALAGCLLTTPPLVCLRFIGYDSKEQIILLCVLLVLIGFFLTLIISPLAADLSFAVDSMEEATPGVFGEQGAYAQAYALFNCAMAAATVVGPILVGIVQDRYGVRTVGWVLGVWCASAAVPVVLFLGDGVRPSEQEDGDAAEA